MMVVTLQQQSIICTSNDVSRVSGNTDLTTVAAAAAPPVPARTAAPIGTTNGKNEDVHPVGHRHKQQ